MCFDFHDENEVGALSLSELQRVIMDMGFFPSKLEREAMLKVKAHLHTFENPYLYVKHVAKNFLVSIFHATFTCSMLSLFFLTSSCVPILPTDTVRIPAEKNGNKSITFNDGGV